MKLEVVKEMVAALSRKAAVGSRLSSAEWEAVSQGIRSRSVFSARVESARMIGGVREKMLAALGEGRKSLEEGGALLTRDQIVRDLRKIALEEGLSGSEPEDGITDLRSSRRLGLIVRTQEDFTRGEARRRLELDPDLLAAFPASRLIRVADRKVPRGSDGRSPSWEERWAAAGEAVAWEGAAPGDLVALKLSPIWRELSRFGEPFPPFDYDSGMGLQDVDRSEAERLGLIAPGEEISAEDPGASPDLEASAEGFSEREISYLRELGIEVVDGKARVRKAIEEEDEV